MIFLPSIVISFPFRPIVMLFEENQGYNPTECRCVLTEAGTTTDQGEVHRFAFVYYVFIIKRGCVVCV